jgi:teichuronic acid biosynthesis glycosyltransferase TuaC
MLTSAPHARERPACSRARRTLASAPRATFRGMLRALVVSDMAATAGHPERGRFVRDQVRELCRLPGLDVELCELAPSSSTLRRLARGGRELRRRYAGARFDVVHAHFGLAAWPALGVRARARALTVHGTDVRHPVTRQLTRAAMPFMDLVCAPSEELVSHLPWPASTRRVELIPCGVDLERFRPLPREQARAQLGLDANRPYVLFPADPVRPEKRYERALALAREVATLGEEGLLKLGGVAPDEVPLWINACNAVLVTSAREGFGLAALEALACDVPVLATPVGIHRQALAGVEGTLCAPFELDRWRTALAPHLAAADPRVAGRERAERYSAARMANLLADAWHALAAPGTHSGSGMRRALHVRKRPGARAPRAGDAEPRVASTAPARGRVA